MIREQSWKENIPRKISRSSREESGLLLSYRKSELILFDTSRQERWMRGEPRPRARRAIGWPWERQWRKESESTLWSCRQMIYGWYTRDRYLPIIVTSKWGRSRRVSQTLVLITSNKNEPPLFLSDTVAFCLTLSLRYNPESYFPIGNNGPLTIQFLRNSAQVFPARRKSSLFFILLHKISVESTSSINWNYKHFLFSKPVHVSGS